MNVRFKLSGALIGLALAMPASAVSLIAGSDSLPPSVSNGSGIQGSGGSGGRIRQADLKDTYNGAITVMTNRGVVYAVSWPNLYRVKNHYWRLMGNISYGAISRGTSELYLTPAGLSIVSVRPGHQGGGSDTKRTSLRFWR